MHRPAQRPLFVLHARLLANARVGVARASARLERDGQRHGGRGRQRGEPLRRQLRAVSTANGRDEGQVIVRAAPFVTATDPAADLASLHGLRVVRLPDSVVTQGKRGRELGADDADVGGEVSVAVRRYHEWRFIVARRHDPEPLWAHLLDAFEQVHINGELQDGPTAGFTCELGVVRLVRPVAEGAGRRHALEDVGVAEPGGAVERSLDDDVCSAAHGLERLRDTGVGWLLLIDLDNPEA